MTKMNWERAGRERHMSTEEVRAVFASPIVKRPKLSRKGSKRCWVCGGSIGVGGQYWDDSVYRGNTFVFALRCLGCEPGGEPGRV